MRRYQIDPVDSSALEQINAAIKAQPNRSSLIDGDILRDLERRPVKKSRRDREEEAQDSDDEHSEDACDDDEGEGHEHEHYHKSVRRPSVVSIVDMRQNSTFKSLQVSEMEKDLEVDKRSTADNHYWKHLNRFVRHNVKYAWINIDSDILEIKDQDVNNPVFSANLQKLLES